MLTHNGRHDMEALTEDGAFSVDILIRRIGIAVEVHTCAAALCSTNSCVCEVTVCCVEGQYRQTGKPLAQAWLPTDGVGRWVAAC